MSLTAIRSLYFINEKFSLLEDSVSTNADHILMALILNSSAVEKHVICCENSPNFFVSQIGKDKITTYHDLNSEPLHWTSNSSLSSTIISLMENVNNASECHVFVDSVSPIIWSAGILQFSRDLHKLTGMVKRVTLRVHSDTLLDRNDIQRLKYFASCNLTVLETLKPSLLIRRYMVEIILRYPDGKFKSKQKECVAIDEKHGIKSEVNTKNVDKPVTKSVNMNALTTFNLGTKLSLSEKSARDQLVLPYLRTAEDESSIIEYEADDVDLEEDPDDDLEL